MSGRFHREAITGTAHCLYQSGVIDTGFLHRAESLAQTANMHVNRALFQIDIAAPDLVLDMVATEDLFLVRHEEFQQLELCGPHVDGGVLDCDSVARWIELQIEYTYDLVLLITTGSA